MSLLDQLILELGERLGIGPLVADQDGIYNIVYDNAVRLRMFENVTSEELIVVSDVIDFSSGELSAEAMRKLLVANFLWAFSARGSFALQPGNDIVQYCLRESLKEMKLDVFELVIKNAIACILTCRRDLSSSHATEELHASMITPDSRLLKG